jgi:hypothetical protein
MPPQLGLPPDSFLSTHFVVGTANLRRPNPTRADPELAAFALPIGLERRLREMKRTRQPARPRP